MRKKTLTLLAILLVITIVLITILFNKPRIHLIEKESYFDTFEIVNGETRIICVLSIENNTSEMITFSVDATFDRDYQNGLVLDKFIKGIWEDTGVAEISLAPKEKVSYKKIIFSSKNAGCDTKMDRKLPEIKLVEK